MASFRVGCEGFEVFGHEMVGFGKSRVGGMGGDLTGKEWGA